MGKITDNQLIFFEAEIILFHHYLPPLNLQKTFFEARKTFLRHQKTLFNAQILFFSHYLVPISLQKTFFEARKTLFYHQKLFFLLQILFFLHTIKAFWHPFFCFLPIL